MPQLYISSNMPNPMLNEIIHNKRKKKTSSHGQGLNLFSMSNLSGQAMLFVVKQGWDKDQSPTLGTIWGLNDCFHIRSQCIQVVNLHWYGLGPLLTLVYGSFSSSDILTNIDRFKFLDIAPIARTATLEKQIRGNAEEDCLASSVLVMCFGMTPPAPHPTSSSQPVYAYALAVLVWGALLDHSLLVHICQSKQWIDCSKLMTI